MKLGLISDTHGFLDPKVSSLFAGVEHILHAGDIGHPAIILGLEQIAPVTAVLGNNDWGLDFRETELLELAGRRFLIHHIVDPHGLTDVLRRRFAIERPDVVVFGHTHRRFSEVIDGTLFVNPGYSGKPKLGLLRSAALLHCNGPEPLVEFLDL